MNYSRGFRGGALGAVCCMVVLGLLVSMFALATPGRASDLGLTEADCRCCHGATLADRHHLLVNTAGLECLSCHETVLNQGTLQFEVVLVRDCLQCHTGSLADRHHVLVNQGGFDCFSCHAMVFDPVTMQYVADFNVSCDNAAAPLAPGTVEGSVTDAGGNPLPWARVASRDGSYSTLTTAAGTYQLADVTPGSYPLDVILDGYVSTSQTVSVVSGQRTSADFSLTALVSPGTVGGTVLSLDMTPIQGARVFAENGPYSTLSGADGTFSLLEVADGSYALATEKAGYVTASQQVTVGAGQALTVNFLLDEIPVEICNDNLDNDSNGLSDCADPACADTAGCLPPAEEICDDGLDNNGNGLTDCADAACSDTPGCKPSPVEICGDNLDNDSNGLTDCSDPGCMDTASCQPPVVETCSDGIDNNGDGLLDCADPICSASASCLPEDCNDGLDNDGNGLTDCADPVCTETSKCLPPPVEICDDGLDNDDNGMVDCTDAKCAEHPTCYKPVTEESCNNGVDDNGDGFIDCADSQCMDRSICLTEICGNNLDDDGDGQADCADSDCGSDPFCTIPESPQPLSFSARASVSESHFEPSKAGDGNMSTRWWGDEDEDEWLRLDLGGIYTINKVVIHWHSDYAEDYKIKVSKDGRYWTNVKEIDNSDGGLDTITFSATEARLILIDCEDAYSDSSSSDTGGFSIYEIEVHQPSSASSTTDPDDGGFESAESMLPEPSNENLAQDQPVRASESEYRYEPYKTADGDMGTRWWVDDDEDEWLRVDLGSVFKVGKVVLHWHSEFAEDYQVKISRDGSNWTTVMEIDNSDGGIDTISFAARDARYVLIDCEEAHDDRSSSDLDGFSIYELEVYRK